MNYIPKTLQELNIITNGYYTKQVDTVIKPKLVEIYDHLIGKKGYDTCVWYGDADVYVHVENIDEDRDVIVIKNIVTGFDKHIIFAVIVRESKYIPLCKCVEGTGKKDERWSFGDHRDWVVVGLDTYRDNDFDFGYNDLRDPDIVFQKDIMRIDWNYNDWSVHSYGCGFIQQNIQFVMHEVDYAHECVVKNQCYT